MGYITAYRKARLAKQKVVEDIYDNWERLYHDLSRLLQAMQQFLPSMVVEKETLPMQPQGCQLVEGYVMFHHFFWSFKPCINEFQYCKPIVQVDGTWLYDKFKGTLLMAVAQDGTSQSKVPNQDVIVGGRNLPIGALVKSIYKVKALFNKKGRKAAIMLAFNQVYMEVLNKGIEDALRKANTHNVLQFDRRDTQFLV
ncbi:hypothetical protein HKD37_16G045155 [Glycine soja]